MGASSSRLTILRQITSVLLVIGFIVWGSVYIGRHPENLTALGNISLPSLITLVLLGLVKLLAMGMFTWINLGVLGVRLDFWEWYGLSAMTVMGNYLLAFRGGAAIRGVYLKSKHQFPYSLFISTVASLYLLTFPTNALLGVVTQVGLYFSLHIFSWPLFAFLLICFVGPLVFLLGVRHVPKLSGRLGDRVNLVLDGWKVLTASSSTIVKLVLASVFNSSVTVLMIHFSFRALGVQLPLVESGVLGILYLIAAMVPITPGGMGFAEGLLVLVSSAFGLDSTINILAAALNRSVMLVIGLCLGPIFTLILTRNSGQSVSHFLHPFEGVAKEESRDVVE